MFMIVSDYIGSGCLTLLIDLDTFFGLCILVPRLWYDLVKTPRKASVLVGRSTSRGWCRLLLDVAVTLALRRHDLLEGLLGTI